MRRCVSDITGVTRRGKRKNDPLTWQVDLKMFGVDRSDAFGAIKCDSGRASVVGVLDASILKRCGFTKGRQKPCDSTNRCDSQIRIWNHFLDYIRIDIKRCGHVYFKTGWGLFIAISRPPFDFNLFRWLCVSPPHRIRSSERFAMLLLVLFRSQNLFKSKQNTFLFIRTHPRLRHNNCAQGNTNIDSDR
jgi:hypothetical protein